MKICYECFKNLTNQEDFQTEGYLIKMKCDKCKKVKNHIILLEKIGFKEKMVKK